MVVCSKKPNWLPFFLIALLGFIVYGQSLFFNLTYLDDDRLLVDKFEILEDIHKISTIFSTDAFFAGTNFYYRPILNLSFMIDAQLGGEALFIYHLDNILLHILAVCLLFLFLKKILKRDHLAFFLSLVFLVHPVLTQAVVWLPGRNDSLMTIFVLASTLFFFNFLDRPRLQSLISCSVFFFLALLTKETAILLPIIFLGYLVTIGRKNRLALIDNFLIILLPLVSTFIYFLMRILALGKNIILDKSALSLADIFHNALCAFGKLLFPFNLSVLPFAADSSALYGWLLILVLMIALLFSKRKRVDYLLFGFIWLLLFFTPPYIMSTIVPYPFEHRLYLPLIGFLIILGEVDWIKDLDFKKRGVKFSSTIVILFFSFLAIYHSLSFSDRLAYWQTAVKDSPHAPLAARNLAAMYRQENQSDLASKYYHRTLELNPDQIILFNVHNNLGSIAWEQKDYSLAEEEYKKEISLFPNNDQAWLNLGNLYLQKNHINEAVSAWKEALRSNPANTQAYEAINKYSK